MQAALRERRRLGDGTCVVGSELLERHDIAVECRDALDRARAAASPELQVPARRDEQVVGRIRGRWQREPLAAEPQDRDDSEDGQARPQRHTAPCDGDRDEHEGRQRQVDGQDVRECQWTGPGLQDRQHDQQRCDRGRVEGEDPCHHDKTLARAAGVAFRQSGCPQTSGATSRSNRSTRATSSDGSVVSNQSAICPTPASRTPGSRPPSPRQYRGSRSAARSRPELGPCPDRQPRHRPAGRLGRGSDDRDPIGVLGRARGAGLVAVTQPPGPLQGRLGSPAHDDGQRRALAGQGSEREIVERVEPALERLGRSRPEVTPHSDRLVEVRTPHAEAIGDPEVRELGLVPADADARDHPPVGQVVERGQLLCEQHRVPLRDDDHAGPEAHLGVPRADPGQAGMASKSGRSRRRPRSGPGRGRSSRPSTSPGVRPPRPPLPCPPATPRRGSSADTVHSPWRPS